MGRRERGLSLAERSGLMAGERAPAGPCHCWIVGDHGERLPGLLLEWRRSGERWLGLVAYVAAGDVLVQRWLDADRLHGRP